MQTAPLSGLTFGPSLVSGMYVPPLSYGGVIELALPEKAEEELRDEDIDSGEDKEGGDLSTRQHLEKTETEDTDDDVCTDDVCTEETTTIGIPFSEISKLTLTIGVGESVGVCRAIKNFVFSAPKTLTIDGQKIESTLISYNDILQNIWQSLSRKREDIRKDSQHLTTEIRRQKSELQSSVAVYATLSETSQKQSSVNFAEYTKELIEINRQSRRTLIGPFCTLLKEWPDVQHNLSILTLSLQNTPLAKLPIILNLNTVAKDINNIFLHSVKMIPGFAPYKCSRLSKRVRNTNRKKISDLKKDIKKLLRLKEKEISKVEEKRRYPGLEDQFKEIDEIIKREPFYSVLAEKFRRKYTSELLFKLREGCVAAYYNDNIEKDREKESALMMYLKSQIPQFIYIREFASKLSFDKYFSETRSGFDLDRFPSEMIERVICYIRYPSQMKVFDLQAHFSSLQIEELEAIALDTGMQYDQEIEKEKEKESSLEAILPVSHPGYISIAKNHMRLLIVINSQTSQSIIPSDPSDITSTMYKAIESNLEDLHSLNSLKEAAQTLLHLAEMATIAFIREKKDEHTGPLRFNFLLEFKTKDDNECYSLHLTTENCATSKIFSELNSYRVEEIKMPTSQQAEESFFPTFSMHYIRHETTKEHTFIMLSEICLKALEDCYTNASDLDISKLVGIHIDKRDPMLKEKYIAQLIAKTMSEQKDSSGISEMCSRMSHKFRKIPKKSDTSETIKNKDTNIIGISGIYIPASGYN